MAIWKDSTVRATPAPAPEPREPARYEPPKPDIAPAPAVHHAPGRETSARPDPGGPKPEWRISRPHRKRPRVGVDSNIDQ